MSGGSAAPACTPCTCAAAWLDPLHEVALDALALGDRDDRLLAVGRAPGAPAEPARLAAHRDGVHVDDVDLERLGHGLGDLLLRRVAADLERVLALVRLRHRLLGDDRAQEHERVRHDPPPCRFSRGPTPAPSNSLGPAEPDPRSLPFRVMRDASASRASRRTTSVSWRRTSTVRSAPTLRTATCCAFAAARAVRSSMSGVTNSVLPVSPSLPRKSTTVRVRGRSSSNRMSSYTRTRPAPARAAKASANASRRIFPGMRRW